MLENYLSFQNIIFVILGIIILFVIFQIIKLYNSATLNKNNINNAKSSLDALFIKRHDLIPNLVETVKGYLIHEKSILEEVTKLRESQNNSSKISGLEEYSSDNPVMSMMKGIMIKAEAYPDLKANEQFRDLQFSWNEVEEQISAGRRFLSSAITKYNDKISVFPANIISPILGLQKVIWEEASEKQKESLEAPKF